MNFDNCPTQTYPLQFLQNFVDLWVLLLSCV